MQEEVDDWSRLYGGDEEEKEKVSPTTPTDIHHIKNTLREEMRVEMEEEKRKYREEVQNQQKVIAEQRQLVDKLFKQCEK